jgi:hypothetical protein
MSVKAINCRKTNRFSLIYKNHHSYWYMEPSPTTKNSVLHILMFLCIFHWSGNEHNTLEFCCLPTCYFKNCKTFLKILVLCILYTIMYFIRSIMASCISSIFFTTYYVHFLWHAGPSPRHGESSVCGRRNSLQYGE